MRIKNVGKARIIFNGGFIAPGKVVELEDEKLGEILVKAYPSKLENLDNVEVSTVVKKAENSAEVSIKKTKRAKKD